MDACVRKTAIVQDEIDCLWFVMLPEICHFVPGNLPLLLSCLSPRGAQRWLHSLLEEAKRDRCNILGEIDSDRELLHDPVNNFLATGINMDIHCVESRRKSSS